MTIHRYEHEYHNPSGTSTTSAVVHSYDRTRRTEPTMNTTTEAQCAFASCTLPASTFVRGRGLHIHAPRFTTEPEDYEGLARVRNPLGSLTVRMVTALQARGIARVLNDQMDSGDETDSRCGYTLRTATPLAHGDAFRPHVCPNCGEHFARKDGANGRTLAEHQCPHPTIEQQINEVESARRTLAGWTADPSAPAVAPRRRCPGSGTPRAETRGMDGLPWMRLCPTCDRWLDENGGITLPIHLTPRT